MKIYKSSQKRGPKNIIVLKIRAPKITWTKRKVIWISPLWVRNCKCRPSLGESASGTF